jgi:predicted ATPase
MKISISGSTNMGKSTYIKDFIKKWPMYKTPEISYRDILTEKNLPHSKEATEETQKVIMDFLVEQAIQSSKEDFVITDRCVLDVLAYSAWLNANGKVTDKFLDEQRILVRETLKLYDVIFFTPITKAASVEIDNDGFREIDETYREEIDNIFKAFGVSYNSGDGRVFPKDDSPAWIEIFGNRDERIKMTEFYIMEDGKSFGEDQSLLSQVIGATENDLKKIEKDMGIIS